MDKHLTALAVVVAAALLAASAAFAGAKPDLTFTFFGKNPEGSFVDTGTPGLSQGDVRVTNRELFNRGGQRVGRVTSTCTVVETADDPNEKVLANCLSVFRLAGGEIVTAGIDAFEHVSDPSAVPTDVDAVVGGTGVYEGVWGTHSFRPISATTTQVVLHLHRH
jgi:hypothetical protein